MPPGQGVLKAVSRILLHAFQTLKATNSCKSQRVKLCAETGGSLLCHLPEIALPKSKREERCRKAQQKVLDGWHKLPGVHWVDDPRGVRA